MAPAVASARPLFQRNYPVNQPNNWGAKPKHSADPVAVLAVSAGNLQRETAPLSQKS
jgi:hypothetical protein